jgi:hypothetical protein
MKRKQADLGFRYVVRKKKSGPQRRGLWAALSSLFTDKAPLACLRLDRRVIAAAKHAGQEHRQYDHQDESTKLFLLTKWRLLALVLVLYHNAVHVARESFERVKINLRCDLTHRAIGIGKLDEATGMLAAE